MNLKIKNYKSFKNENIIIKKINYFIGKNESGKSNLLDSIYEFDKFHQTLKKENKNKNFELEDSELILSFWLNIEKLKIKESLINQKEIKIILIKNENESKVYIENKIFNEYFKMIIKKIIAEIEKYNVNKFEYKNEIIKKYLIKFFDKLKNQLKNKHINLNEIKFSIENSIMLQIIERRLLKKLIFKGFFIEQINELLDINNYLKIIKYKFFEKNEYDFSNIETKYILNNSLLSNDFFLRFWSFLNLNKKDLKLLIEKNPENIKYIDLRTKLKKNIKKNLNHF